MNDAGKAKKGLFWFRNDLRLHDVPSLSAIAQEVEELLLIYIVDSDRTDSPQFGCSRLGSHRRIFIAQCIEDLNNQLSELGQQINVLDVNAAEFIPALIASLNITHVGFHYHPGNEETQDVIAIKAACPDVTYIEHQACSLFNSEQLPFFLRDIPAQFTPFRKKIEASITPLKPVEPIVSLPPAMQAKNLPLCDLKNSNVADFIKPQFTGGERAGLAHLQHYLFTTLQVKTYKETRNALDDWPSSTKLSPWLAAGALSPRYIYQQLKQCEQQHGANESTYWVYFELLWREFFHWSQVNHGHHWFMQAGIRHITRPFAHDEQKIEDWKNGNTGYEIVDACMRQLKQTGYMSNRGRQLVASCLVHELQQNWQVGAAWFEHQLIDYDVGSNWGNWLYLAGVGHDPRGHRQFDLAKQTQTYDPNGTFRSKWLD